MARFRKARRYARKVFRAARRYTGSEKDNVIESIITGGLYGAVRKPIGDAIPDLPVLGAYSDNVLLGLGSAGMAIWGKGIVKKIGFKLLTCESFLSGARLSSGIMPSSSGGSLANINY